jgi:hypothetical protein
MPPVPPPLDTVARKWSALAERRLVYYTDLYRSGRWKHYYTEREIAVRMLDVIKAARQWAELASGPRDEHDDLRPAA